MWRIPFSRGSEYIVYVNIETMTAHIHTLAYVRFWNPRFVYRIHILSYIFLLHANTYMYISNQATPIAHVLPVHEYTGTYNMDDERSRLFPVPTYSGKRYPTFTYA